MTVLVYNLLPSEQKESRWFELSDFHLFTSFIPVGVSIEETMFSVIFHRILVEVHRYPKLFNLFDRQIVLDEVLLLEPVGCTNPPRERNNCCLTPLSLPYLFRRTLNYLPRAACKHHGCSHDLRVMVAVFFVLFGVAVISVSDSLIQVDGREEMNVRRC